MFVVKVDYKSGQSYAFIFTSEDAANDAAASLLEAKPGAVVPLQDDHGHSASLTKNELVGIMTSDLIKETFGRQALEALMKQLEPKRPAGEIPAGGDTRWADPSLPQAVHAPIGPATDTSMVDPKFGGVPGRPGNPPFAS